VRAAQDAAAAKNDAAAAKPIAAPMARPKAAALAEPTAAQDAAPYVQVAAFGDPANAAETARRFRARDLPAFEMPAGGLRLVLLGPFDTMDAARRARDIAAADGFADAYVAVR
jgi:cell division septation protein DedD